MKRGAIAIAACIALIACSRMGPDQRETNRENGEAKWTEQFARAESRSCELRGEKRREMLGPDASEIPRPDSERNCMQSSLFVRNDSARLINCQVRAKLPARDDSNRMELDFNWAIFPGNRLQVAGTLGSRESAPDDLRAQCEILPAVYTPQRLPPGCKLRLDFVPNPDDYYPDESFNARATGAVVIEFAVDNLTNRLTDLRVAKSSGFEALDNAALLLGGDSRGRSTCKDQRYRFKVRFVFAETPSAADQAVERN